MLKSDFVNDTVRTLWRLRLVLLLVMTCADRTSGDDALEVSAQDMDFRTKLVPAEIHIFESKHLTEIVDVTKEQNAKISELIQIWKRDYLRRENEVVLLPDGDKRRRGWPPSRDRELSKDVESVLNAEQMSRYQQVKRLWEFSPVHFQDIFRFNDELSLSDDQVKKLYALNKLWTLDSISNLPQTTEPDLGDQFDSYRSIVKLAWEFKESRDSIWQDILTPEQVRRWKQRELRQAFRADMLVVIDELNQSSQMAKLASGQFPRLVPYFDSPNERLKWSNMQRDQIIQIQQELDDPVQQMLSIRDREKQINVRAELGKKIQAARKAIENLANAEQRNVWQELFGPEQVPPLKLDNSDNRASILTESKESEATHHDEAEKPLQGPAPQMKVKPDELEMLQEEPILKIHPVKELEANGRFLTSLAFTLDGKFLAVGTSQSTIHLWDVETEELIAELASPDREVTDICVTQDGEHLVAATSEGTLLAWKLSSQQQILEISGPDERIETIAAGRNSNVVTGSSDGIVRSWNVRERRQIDVASTLDQRISALTFSTDSSRIVAGTDAGELVIWKSLNKNPQVIPEERGIIFSVAFSPDDRLLAIGNFDRSITLRQSGTWRELWNLSTEKQWSRVQARFSTDGRFLVSARDYKTKNDDDSYSTEIELWNTQTHELAGRLVGHEARINDIAVSSDGEYIAGAGQDGKVRLWRSPFQHAETFYLRRQVGELTQQLERDNLAVRTNISLLQKRAFLSAKLKHWRLAASDFQAAQELAPHDTMHWMRAGVMLLLADDQDAYREHTQKMLEHFEIPANAYVAERTAKLCVLPKKPIGDQDTAERLAAFGTENSGDSPWSMYFPTTEAIVKYRYRDYDAALKLIELSNQRNDPGEERPDVAEMLNHVVEGLCWAAKRDADRAQQSLSQADKYLDPFRKQPTTINESAQHDWFIGQMLYVEAEELLNKDRNDK